MDEKQDLMEEIVYSARELMKLLRETYELGDLDEHVDECLQELTEKFEALDEYEDSDDDEY